MTTNSEKNSERLNYPSGSKWEDIIGYSRVVKMGNIVEMSGTTATDEDGQVQGINDPYQQTRYILGKVAKYLQMAGATMEDVIRTRIFVTDISQWEAVGRAHGEFFGDIKPTTSMVEVAKLINPELLVEIEVSAVVHS